MKAITRCRICNSDQLTEVLNLGTQALTGVFPKAKTQKVNSGPLELVKCMGKCGLVQLRHTYDLDQLYGQNYGYRSGLNPSMVRHLNAKVARILSLGVLEPGDVVIDIGSNDATTLRAYPKDSYELIGIDPTGSKFSHHYPAYIRLVPEFFSVRAVGDAIGNRRAKVITSFSMFYDLEDPVGFMRGIEGSLDNQGIWVFEQSYLPAMLRTNSFDTVCHEHLEFYSLKQIIWMAERAGLKVLDVEFNEVNGGSFSITAGKASSRTTANSAAIVKVLEDESRAGLDGLAVWTGFRARVDSTKRQLLAFLDNARNTGKRVCGLGASTKGNVLLQYFGIDERLLPVIGEVNEDKFGAFTPGSLIPLVPEAEVLASKPDFLLVLPWHFRDFFVKLPSMRGRTLVFPLPRLDVVKL